MLLALSILLLLADLAVTLISVVFFMGCGANAKPADIAILKTMIFVALIAWLLCTVGGIWAMVAGRHGVASVVAAVPIVITIVQFVVLFRMGP
ncbi:MAG: hypothetical protein DYG92_02965 [Leptolyngbya sp. PLA1]|nr:hypothetical protein [Leptolyngbya sp. PLA1]